MTFHALRGLGDDSTDLSLSQLSQVLGTSDTGTTFNADSSVNAPDSSNITAGVNQDLSNLAIQNALTPLGTGAPTGSASTGFNWGTFLSSLIGAGAATTTSVLNSGSTTAQVQAQSAAQIAAAQASAAQSSTLMTLGLVGVAGVVLVMIFSGGKR